MRLIDADAIIKALNSNCKPELCHDYKTAWCVACCPHNDFVDLLEEAPTVEERPQGECKSCKYYHPYYAQFTNEPRGDGYCTIARMTFEGMTTINCNDSFYCSDYQKGGAE